MVRISQIISYGIVLGLLGGGGWIMHQFFGAVGVVMLLGFTIPILALVGYLSGGSGSSGGTGNYGGGRVSKGAKQSQED